LIKLLPYILFAKYIYILALKMASPGNQHCARCMDTVVNLLLPAHRRHYAMLRCVRPSVRLSAPYPWFKDDAFHGYDYYRTLATGSRTHWAAWHRSGRGYITSPPSGRHLAKLYPISQLCRELHITLCPDKRLLLIFE